VRLWEWRQQQKNGRCLAVLLPDGRELAGKDVHLHQQQQQQQAGAASTSSAAAAAAPSQRAPPASVGAASCVAAQALDARGERVLLAVASAAQHIAVWECDVAALVAMAAEEEEEGGASAAAAATAPAAPPPAHLIQRLRVEGCLQHALALTALPTVNSADPPPLLLASGGTDGAVRLFVRPATTPTASGSPRPSFAPAATLTGHDNWVRGLAFVHTFADDRDEEDDSQLSRRRRRAILLASASQDTRVRVWRLEEPAPAEEAAVPSSADANNNDDDEEEDARLDAALLRYAPRAAVRVPAAAAAAKTTAAAATAAPSSSSCFEWTASLEALLSGHEDWVHAVQWRPALEEEAETSLPLHLPPAPRPRSTITLLSASHDRTAALWRREPRSGVWMGEAALGDAGATCFGYFGARWGPRGTALVAHGHTGAMHMWREHGSGSSSAEWRPAAAGGGHVAAVVDLAWVAVPDSASRRPRLLLHTASTDQTARVFAEVAEEGPPPCRRRRRWCELARSQVHGHDFSALAAIPSPPPPPGTDDGADAPALMYACCSEEKVLRVFEAPQAFLDTLALTQPDDDDEEEEGEGEGNDSNDNNRSSPPAFVMTPEQALRARGGRRGRPVGAAAQALGLSNKALFAEDCDGGGDRGNGNGNNAGNTLTEAEGPDQAPNARPAAVQGPPLEEHLAQSTQWPELAKMHGHRNDAFCCAASPCGTLLASACRAQASKPGDADVWVWEVGSWRAVARLGGGHTLTATQLAFCALSGGEGGAPLLLLASVSRDRSLAVWRQRRQETNCPSTAEFELVSRVPAAHSRVIWGVAWAAAEAEVGAAAATTPSPPLLATGARDGLVRVWEVLEKDVRRVGQLPTFPAAVTAVAAAPRAQVMAAGGAGSGRAMVLAVGLEDGGVQVWHAWLDEEGSDLQHRLLWRAGPGQRHAAAVRRLAWAPVRGGGGGGERRCRRRPYLLASCGEDAAVRIYEVVV
jgi:elongator complex protein 2